jgi:hypothetical protein
MNGRRPVRAVMVTIALVLLVSLLVSNGTAATVAAVGAVAAESPEGSSPPKSPSSASKGTKKFKTCPVKRCGVNQTSEIASWECLGRHLFRPTDDPMSEMFVEHDCGGVGWGNSIRALYNAFAIAAVLDRRIIVRYSPGDNPMWKLWDPPYDLDQWNYGVDVLREEQFNIPAHMRGKSWDFGSRQYKDMWDFEKYGRSPGRFGKWVKNLKKSKELQTEYSQTVLNTAICGGEPEFFTDGACITKTFPLYEKCLKEQPRMHLPDAVMLVPFFHSVFSKPSALMAHELSVIRNRLDLPQLDPGYEPVPGAWGLQTPGYYIFALHFRRVPLGFEPLSAELSKDNNLEWRLSILKAFWKQAVTNAKQAKKIAKCRNETLLIYFATDDIQHLRPEAKKYLGSYGRVVFGLADREVGHISAQWTQNSITDVQNRAVEMFREGKLGVGSSSVLNKKLLASGTEMEVNGQGLAVRNTEPNLADLLVDVDTDEQSANVHARMALVEWYLFGII